MVSANSKNNKIQILRAIAICAVVIIHSYPQNLFGVFIRSFVNFAVSLFLFLSGYLTKLEYDDWKKIWIKRISRVVIPYIVWSILYTLISRKFDSFFIKLLTGRILVPYYFVVVYIQFVLFSPLISRLAKSKFRWVGWLFQPVSIVLLQYFGFSKYIPFAVLFSWFCPYYLGLLLGNHVIHWDYNYKKTGLFWLISFVVSIAEGLFWYSSGNYNLATTQAQLSNIIYSVACCLLAYKYITDDSIKINPTRANRMLVLLGDCSFGVFLTHLFVLKALQHLSFYKYLVFPINSTLVIVITAICVYCGQRLLGKKLGKYLGFC